MVMGLANVVTSNMLPSAEASAVKDVVIECVDRGISPHEDCIKSRRKLVKSNVLKCLMSYAKGL